MTTMDSPSTSSSEPWKRRRVKHCFVPHCLSSSTLFPYKEFLGVPRDPTQRKMWMDAVGLKSSFIPSQNMQCCEDHFDMEKDILNCSKYRGYLQLKKGVIPHKFDHQRHSKNKHDTKQKVDNEHKIECLDPKDITETTVIPTNVEDSLPSCGEARVKSERSLPQFCLACFAVDRTLAPPGDLLGLYCSLVEDWEIPQQPVYLCWECRALLRRVRDFTRNVATVHAFLQEYQRDQDTPLPPPLSRLVQATMEGEVPARPITTGLTEVKVKHEGPGTPDVVYYDVKLEPKDEDDVQSDDHIWKDEEPASADTVRDRKTPSESRKKPKQKKENNKKYVYVNNENFCLEDFYTKVPINHAELTSLLEQDRQSEQFLQQPHRCEDCFHGWKMKGSKMEHDLRRHGDVSLSYQCDICKIRLGGKMQLSVHIREHYFARQCGQCGYCTATRYLMRKHVLREHRKRVQCRTCDAQFYELREFHRHYRASHSVGQFQCDHCGQRRTTRAAIERHIKRHMERRKLERPYCVECDKYFRTFETYKQHLISKAHGVNNSGRVACPACGKTYARAGYMRAHYACVHLARPRYKCAHCGQCCLDNSAYRDHMRRRHTPGYKKPRPKVCPYCERNFASKFHLDNHVRTHTGERPFACEFCPARFGAKTALQSHVDYTHLKRKRKTYGPRIRKTSDVEPA